VTTVPWCELFPSPELPIVAIVSLALSFWYGYRHPEGY
jgi:hypothetical protein